jgi:glucose-6-phosphate 1-dehydrogenase
VQAAWQFVDPILTEWSNRNKSNPPKLPNYAAGSWGPEESDKLIASEGFSWRRL